MKKTGFLVFLLVLSMLVSTVSFAADTTAVIYVAPNGSDAGDGSIDAPFATLQAAQGAVRKALKEGSGVRVYLREGTYYMDQTLSLTAEDSGTESEPVIYSSYPGESAVITGGKTIPGSAFSKVTDPQKIAGLGAEAAENVYCVDLKANGITDLLDDKPAMMVFCNGQSMRLARWPNEGYYIVPDVVDPGTYLRNYGEDVNDPRSPDYIPPEEQKNDPGVIVYDAENIDRWTNPDRISLEGYWGVLWSTDILKIAKRDTEKKQITFDRATAYAVVPSIARFYAYNVFEEIDVPGEYYIDRDAMKLYLYPYGEMENASVELVTSDHEFFNLQDTSDVVFTDLSFETNATTAFAMNGGENITIEHCNFSRILDMVIKADQTVRLGVASCNFNNIGGEGIDYNGGDRQTLTSSETFVENCRFETFSQILKTYNPAIYPRGVGIRMSNNVFHDAPHTAILFNGNDMLIEYNEIYDVLKETDDCGSIYAGRDMTWRGNKLFYNYIHDLEDVNGQCGRAAVYMDDGMSSITAFGNIFANMQKGFLMGGRDHVVANNILYKVVDPISFDARQANMTHDDLLEPDSNQTIPQRFQSIPYDSEIWKARFPEVYEMSLDENPGFPKHNSAYNNALITCGEPQYAAAVLDWAKRIENNVAFSSKKGGLQISMDGHTPSVSDNSEIYTAIPEFEQIPTDRMGNYTDRLNAKLTNAVALFVDSPNALVNGNKKLVDPADITVVPRVISDRTLVPLRFIAENFGADVAWEEATETVTVTDDAHVIVLRIGSDVMTVNGEEIMLDVPAATMSDRTMIPLRAVSEALGKSVLWEDRGLILISDAPAGFEAEKDDYLLDDLIRRLRY